MNDQSINFEIFSIALLFVAGVVLLSADLPGWGLIAIAAVLTALSIGLRKMPVAKVATSTVV